MAVRSTMASLIARLRSMLNDDATFSDQALQNMLDYRGSSIGVLLRPRAPAYTVHVSGMNDMEDGAQIYALPGVLFPGWQASNLAWADSYMYDARVWWLEGLYTTLTPLVTPTDYTLDPLTGSVTTPVADLRGLFLAGRAYLMSAAACDGWQAIAARYATQTGEIKSVSSDGSTVVFTSPYANAIAMAKLYCEQGSGGNLAF